MLSPPTFDEILPPSELANNIRTLTEEALKKNTKTQERLYLQKISEEQPLLLNMHRIKKRPRVREEGEETESAKHPCTNSGVFRTSPNFVMQSFPAVTSSDLTTVTSTTQTLHHQPEIIDGTGFDRSFMADNPGNVIIPEHPTLHLFPGKPVPSQCISSNLSPMIPRAGIHRANQTKNMQWPYYPQTGLTLMPQVMSGFYRPLLQPLQVQAIHAQPGGFSGNAIFQEPLVQNCVVDVQPVIQSKTGVYDKKNGDSDSPSSSEEDTMPSILSLLEVDSSSLEDSDYIKASTGNVEQRLQNKRSMEPPWLRGVKWSADTKMRYTVPQRETFLVLKMDEMILKNTQQSELVQGSLVQLLEDISLSDHQDPTDEETDYIIFPGDEVIDDMDRCNEKIDEVDVSQSSREMDGGGGGGSDGGGGDDKSNSEVVRSQGVCRNDDSFDTPMNSQSESEKSLASLTQEGIKEEKAIKDGENQHLEGSRVVEGGGSDLALESVFINNSQTSRATLLMKRGSSPEDGFLSGDEGSRSDSGQKVETEESQSSCSTVFSDLTPSDDGSNEEAGSLLKESESSLSNMKGVSSVASSKSSHDHIGHEDSLYADTVGDGEDFFRKLFVPLKVRVSHQVDTPGTPFWLEEAHLSHRVAMTYMIPSRQLEEVLSEDKRKMSSLVQSSTVKQQLLQLLREVDLKSGTPSSIFAPVSSTSPASSVLAPAVLSSNINFPITTTAFTSFKMQTSSLSDSFMKSVPGETNSDDKSVDPVKLEIDEKVMTCACPLSVPFMENIRKENSTSTVQSETKTCLLEEPAHLTAAKSWFVDFTKGIHGCHVLKSSPKQNGSTGGNNSSNSDLLADELCIRAADMGHSSSTNTTTTCEMGHSSSTDTTTACEVSPQSCTSSRRDSCIQESLQGLEPARLCGQNIEDIIVSKIFFPPETPCAGLEAKHIPSSLHLVE